MLFLDSFDSAALGYVAPAITELWHLPRGALGPVFASGFFGQLIGAVVAGPVADRVGRKPVMVAACIAFGVGALITTQASSLSTLLAVRLLTGVGLGAALPNAVALVVQPLIENSIRHDIGPLNGSGWISSTIMVSWSDSGCPFCYRLRRKRGLLTALHRLPGCHAPFSPSVWRKNNSRIFRISAALISIRRSHFEG